MKQRIYVVTGAGGFVGAALCRMLIEAGHKVRGVARGKYPEVEALGVEMRQLDLSQSDGTLSQIVSGADGVFHTAAKVDMWGRYEDFFAVNVLGTRNVVKACREANVPRLVFTSSPSVIAHGEDLKGVDESVPYPTRHQAYYPMTKAIAEQEVLAANQKAGFHTLSLRPHLIFGPRDNHLVPTILERARAGRLVQVGAGENVTDLTFIDDCVRAHVLAMEALELRPNCRGRSFFITQGEPVKMWEWINDVLRRSGLSPVSRRVPKSVAMFLASGFEIYSRVRPETKPLLTKFLVSQMSTDHYFSIAAAKEELGYFPRHSMKEAMDKTFSSASKLAQAA